MSQSAVTVPELHADHRHWKSEIACWQDDVERWGKQHAEAQKTLKLIAGMIADHAKSLDEHADSIQKNLDGVEYHEQTICASLQGESDRDLDDALVKRHEEQAASIASHRDAHERIKKHHHTAMAQLAMLRAALESAM